MKRVRILVVGSLEIVQDADNESVKRAYCCPKTNR
jgi:hypothetical protein